MEPRLKTFCDAEVLVANNPSDERAQTCQVLEYHMLSIATNVIRLCGHCNTSLGLGAASFRIIFTLMEGEGPT